MNTSDKVISYTALFTFLTILLSSVFAVFAAIALWTDHVSHMFWFETTKNGLSLAWKIAVCGILVATIMRYVQGKIRRVA